MATITAIRTGLQTRLATISGLRAQDVVPDTAIPPAAIIRYMGPVDGPYATIGGDSYDEFEITVVVPIVHIAKSEADLDGYRSRSGSSSIQVAIEGDETLAGAVHFAEFAGWDGGTDMEECNGVEYPAAKCRVRVWH